MADKAPNITMTTTERQVLEHPAYLRLFLFVLVPFFAGFNIYLSMTGRIWPSALLSFQLAGSAGVLGVMGSGLAETRKIIIYRYLFRLQLLAFGAYLILVVGFFHWIEASFWCFLFVFIVSMWMPDRTGVWTVLVFNAGMMLLDLGMDMNRFMDQSEFLIRFYLALFVFSFLAMSAGQIRNRYLGNLYRTREGLEESERKYRELNETLIREIEHRDRIEKRLHHAIKMETVGSVAAGVAHDLNNILSGIVTYPELLLLDLKPDDPLRGPLESIRASGVRAAAIVDDLLTLARRGVSAIQRVSLCRIVADYMASPECRQLTAGFPDVTVRTAYEAEDVFVNGSPAHLSKTLMNLVTNGVEAVAGPGEVAVTVSRVLLEAPVPLTLQIQGEKEIPPGTYARLRVKDTGSGINPADLESIFEPFYTKKQMGRSGTGLGMALVLGAVNDHGGYLQMDSMPGQGTCIAIYLPLAGEITDPETKIPEQISYEGHGESVLVVDDEPIQRKIAQTLLQRMGYQAMTCPSGEAALAFLATRTVDLVILDIIMEPGMNGVETCEIILEKYPGQKVLFVTGYSDTVTLAKAGALSQGSCLDKPYSLEKMGRLVKERLAGAS